ncbi:hypothetical protein CB1_000880045 [Camelus ferus]|nr:hypothetical protein CB1_000880045 [Camelus ferus]
MQAGKARDWVSAVREINNEGSTDEKSSPPSSQEGSPPGDRQFSPKSNTDKSKGELMFDDSSDSSPEKQERNLNWTPAEVPQLAAVKRRLPPGKEPSLINLCANVPPVPGSILPPEVRGNLMASGQNLQSSERSEMMASWSPAVRTLRNITNNADIQQINRPSNVAHILQSLSAPTKTLEPQVNHSQQGHASAVLLGQIIRAHGGTVDPTLSSRCTHLLCESQVSGLFAQAMKERRRCVTAHWLNAVLKKKQMVPPHRALHFPVAFPPGGKPCSQHIISVTGFVDSDRDDLKLMAYLAGARYTGYLCRSNTVLICKEPTGLKYEKAREWRIPCVNAQWLGDILLGNFEALRQIQYGRYTAFNLQDPFAPTPHLVLNLLGSPLNSVIALTFLLTRCCQPHRLCIWGCLESAIEGVTRAADDLALTCVHDLQKLYILGGEVAESAQKCTHLIASKVTRTVKFLTAVSVVKHIVTPEWLEECFRCQKFIDEQNYLLRDAEAEVLFSFSLEESLRRAHVSPLFKAKYFYITPGICPSLATMKAIVECAGGRVLSRQPSFRRLMEHKQNKVTGETRRRARLRADEIHGLVTAAHLVLTHVLLDRRSRNILFKMHPSSTVLQTPHVLAPACDANKRHRSVWASYAHTLVSALSILSDFANEDRSSMGATKAAPAPPEQVQEESLTSASSGRSREVRSLEGTAGRGGVGGVSVLALQADSLTSNTEPALILQMSKHYHAALPLDLVAGAGAPFRTDWPGSSRAREVAEHGQSVQRVVSPFILIPKGVVDPQQDQKLEKSEPTFRVVEGSRGHGLLTLVFLESQVGLSVGTRAKHAENRGGGQGTRRHV